MNASFLTTVSTATGSTMAARLCLVGDIDLSVHDQLRRRLDDLEHLPASHFELAAARVDYIDCASIGLLLASRRRLLGHGHELRVVSCSPFFDRLVTLAGLSDVLAPRAASRPGAPARPTEAVPC